MTPAATWATIVRQRPPPLTLSARAIDLFALPASNFDVTYQRQTVVIDPISKRKIFQRRSSPAIRKLEHRQQQL